ncbi:hypothetical protein DV451_001704 [Geotrichum candidum]|uniref:Mediator of RNA polymerase II transcription subunit 4 n=1 Tax=Geotrichum candidum TaxID=1173061 RepID=A0A9P5G870_GEOCN|nr:hypothetical protein DV451_001704 [Geotrichum candidum]KAF5105797.1 hypothetical protein DV453_004515 [Geotrichum candidum]
MQPFTPPSLNPATPGSTTRLRVSSGLYQTPTTPSQLSINTPMTGSSEEVMSNSTDKLGRSAIGGASGNNQGNKIMKPTVAGSLDKFEKVLAGLVESVARFRPSPELAQKLIDVDVELSESLEELARQHKATQRLKKLRKTSEALDEQLNTLLVTLADCRRTLRALPKPDEKVMKEHSTNAGLIKHEKGVFAKDLLRYATKITKFTSAPPGYQTAPEHANLPWPTDDEMRRGVLALSAITGISEEAQPTTDKEEAPVPEAPKASSSEPESDSKSGAPLQEANGFAERRNSITRFGEEDTSVAPTTHLDLDLFDPDDDDDDDDDEDMVDV